MSALANVLTARANLTPAFDFYTKSIKVHLRVPGRHHKTAGYNKLAWFLQKQGEYKMAMYILRNFLMIESYL